MTTRATLLSAEHVQALNAIELAYYGGSRQDKAVREAWTQYHSHLNSEFDSSNQAVAAAWGERRTDLLIDLMYMMARRLGYDFDKAHIKRSWYAPKFHADVEQEMHIIRSALKKVLTGERSFNISVVPSSMEEAQQNFELRRLLTDWLRTQNSGSTTAGLISPPSVPSVPPKNLGTR